MPEGSTPDGGHLGFSEGPQDIPSALVALGGQESGLFLAMPGVVSNNLKDVECGLALAFLIARCLPSFPI